MIVGELMVARTLVVLWSVGIALLICFAAVKYTHYKIIVVDLAREQGKTNLFESTLADLETNEGQRLLAGYTAGPWSRFDRLALWYDHDRDCSTWETSTPVRIRFV